jgi:hypothetical protein
VTREVASLERAGVDARGSTPHFAKLADGRRLFVKALGQDERDADLLFRAGGERACGVGRDGANREPGAALAAPGSASAVPARGAPACSPAGRRRPPRWPIRARAGRFTPEVN